MRSIIYAFGACLAFALLCGEMVMGTRRMQLEAESVLPYSNLEYGKYPSLVSVCPMREEIMRHNVSCNVIAFVMDGLRLANSTDPQEQATGYRVLDAVLDFLDDNPGSVPVNDIWGDEIPGVQGGFHTIVAVGAGNGFSIVDASVPLSMRQIGFFPGYFSTWRDVKSRTINDKLYFFGVHDSQFRPDFLDSLVNVNKSYVEPFTHGDGLSVIAMDTPGTPHLLGHFTDDFTFAHNIWVDTDPARPYAYVCGGDVTAGVSGNDGGLLVLNIEDPANPTAIAGAHWAAYYVHDLVVVPKDGRVYALAAGIEVEPPEPSVYVLDVTDVTMITNVALRPARYPLTHNIWPTPDLEYAYVTHEDVGMPVTIWDIRDLTNPEEIGEIFLTRDNQGISAHNAFVRTVDDACELVISYYTAGVAVYDCENPRHPELVSTLDTSPSQSEGFGGAWGVYPFSVTGRIFASDMATGLWSLHEVSSGEQVTVDRTVGVGGAYAVGAIGLVFSVAALGVLGWFVWGARRRGAGSNFVPL